MRKFGYLKVPMEQNYRTVFALWWRAGNRLLTLLSLLILQAIVLLYCEYFSIAITIRLSQVGLGSFHVTLITVVLKTVFWQQLRWAHVHPASSHLFAVAMLACLRDGIIVSLVPTNHASLPITGTPTHYKTVDLRWQNFVVGRVVIAQALSTMTHLRAPYCFCADGSLL